MAKKIKVREYDQRVLKELAEYFRLTINDSPLHTKACYTMQRLVGSLTVPDTITLPDITLDEADELWKETDYACFASTEVDEINSGDAASFFIEGYNYARKKFNKSNQ